MEAEAYVAEARKALAARNYRKAAGAARAAANADPRRSDARLVEAKAREAMGDLAGAVPLFAGLVREGEGGTASVSAYASLAFRRGEGAEALDVLARRVRETPGDAELRGVAGWLALAIGRAPEARNYLEATWGTEVAGRYAVHLARARLVAGDLDGASEAIELARSTGEKAHVWVLLGDMRRARGAGARAEQAYLRALELEPEDYVARVNLGVLKLSQGDASGAAALFAEAVEVRPEAPDAWNDLGLARRAQGDLEGAQQAYTQALTVSPGFPPALRNLGILKEKYLGQPAAALPYYDRYLHLRPDDEDVSRWRKVAKRLGEKAQ
jgi:tetratricopeptide (TPR) repeat protein